MLEQTVRGPLLIPKSDGSVQFINDGALAADSWGMILFAGAYAEMPSALTLRPVRRSDGVILPPLLDIHTHVSQHAVRGKFTEGVSEKYSAGKLLAGLNRNVFPAEARCSEPDYAEKLVQRFLADTLSHGVVGGAAYMTVSAKATDIALSILPASWSVGMVLMNQNCPESLRTDEPHLDADIERLANKFGQRLIITDRFAVAVDSPLRRRASALATKYGLRTQTHLNEQLGEKRFVEKELYPHSASYTDLYRQDGLLDHQCIAAHCIQMTPDEWAILRDFGSVIAHCPTSNFLLGSGVMSLNKLFEYQIPYALATDVGASSTVSMLAEMRRFLQVHDGRSKRATAVEALFRSTLAPAELLGLSSTRGLLTAGALASFIEVKPRLIVNDLSAESVIQSILPVDPDRPDTSVRRVTIAGRTVFERSAADA